MGNAVRAGNVVKAIWNVKSVAFVESAPEPAMVNAFGKSGPNADNRATARQEKWRNKHVGKAREPANLGSKTDSVI